MKCGCENCQNLRCYRGGYWDPDEYECAADGPDTEELLVRVWENCETWDSKDEPLCSNWKEMKEPDYEYYEIDG